MPEDLLAEVDAEAARIGSTRSAVLRGFADAALRKRRRSRAQSIDALIGKNAAPQGGNNAERLKDLRP